MPFCIGCGVRINPGEQKCPACQAREQAGKRCPRCGQPVGGPVSQFCVFCGATLTTAPNAARPAAPTPAAAAAAPSAPLPAAPPRPPAASSKSAAEAQKAAAGGATPPQQKLIDATRRDRQVVYQRLGRMLLADCYEGRLAYDKLPAELARQAKGGIVTIRKGHATLVGAGVCPRCLEAAVSGQPPKCARCGFSVPGSAKEK